MTPQDKKLLKIGIQDLWKKLGDVPINTEEEIEESFLHFPKGTHREEVWSWFEETFNLSVTDLMYIEKVKILTYKGEEK